MTEVEKIVRAFDESWDLRDPDRGASVIADDCHFEDVARGELLSGPDGYKLDYERWRAAFPDGEVKLTNVIVQDDCAVVEFINWGDWGRSTLGRLGSVQGKLLNPLFFGSS